MFKSLLLFAALAPLVNISQTSGRLLRDRTPKKRTSTLRNTPEIEAWNREVDRKKAEKLKAKLERRASRIREAHR